LKSSFTKPPMYKGHGYKEHHLSHSEGRSSRGP
jgi:hypothetical protein